MTFRFIDLFAGLGGIRIPFEEYGGVCVFSSEWDKFAQISYEANHGERPNGDITQISPSEIPNFDLLLGGFPCQPFSNAGQKKDSRMREALCSLTSRKSFSTTTQRPFSLKTLRGC